VVRRPAPVLTAPRPTGRRRRGGGGRSRGAAAGAGLGILVLGAPLVALAYFLAAPALPGLAAGDETVLVAGGIGLLLVAAVTLSLLPARDALVGPLLIALGSGLVGGALNAADVGAGANVAEAMLAGAAGLLFARWLRAPAVALAVPLFVGAIDVWSVASGPTSRLLENGAQSADALSFDLPAWGDHGSAGHLGVSDAIFVSMFAAWAYHFGFRRVATIVGILLGLLGSLGLSLVLDEAIPALPLVAAGYLLPNLDRAWRLLRPREMPTASG
jgi:hypothetical protein